MSIQAKQYINGKWADSESGQRATRENPANISEVVGSYPLSGAKETNAAIASLLTGGKKPAGKLENGYFIEPAVFDKVDPGSELGQKEIFGPVLGILAARDLKQSLEIANHVAFGLIAAIFTKDISRILRFIKSAEAGMIKINGETAGVEPHAPFGGLKQSSSHSREQGRAAIDFFTSIQTIAISPFDDQ